MELLEKFLAGDFIKKAPATEDERPNIFNDKGTNNSINSQEFDEFCEKEYNRIVAEDAQACEWVTATPTPSSAMARELAPVPEYETQHAAPMPIDNTEHTRKKKSLHSEPQLPLWGMPELFQQYCESVTSTYQCPREFVLAAMMAAVSTAVGNKVVVKSPKYNNSLSLWCIAVAPSGSNKSEPIREVLRPLTDINNEYAREYEELLAAQGDGKEPPKIKRIILKDCTPEARTETLKNNPNGVLLYVDEIASFFQNLCRYNQNAGITDLLSLYDGDVVQQDRKSSAPTTIPKSFLNMLGTIQPGRLGEIFSKSEYVSSGFNQRIMFCFPDCVDFPPLNDAVISDEWREAWNATITALVEMEPCDFVLHRESEAYAIYYEYHTKLQQLKKEATAMGDDYLSSIYSKLQIQVLRVAGIVHAMWCAAGVSGTDITPSNMRYAIECLSYFEYTARKVMNTVQQPPGININNMQLLRLIYDRFRVEISNREMARVLNVSHTFINNARK